MNRRKLGVVGLALVALMAFGVAIAQQPKKPKAKTSEKPAAGIEHTEHNEGLQACAKACSDCQRECDMCSTHCGHQLAEGKKEHMMTLMTCQDCADICAAASHVTARGGPFSGIICVSCADACAACAKECEKFPDDEHMTACAKECRKCEKACREMAKHAGHGHDHADEEKK
ncbi:MAG: four-helix bundle copper-binding protein [Pirellulaceae bacterium]